MSYDHPTERWEPANFDQMLAMLPVVEDPDFVGATWSEAKVEVVDGRMDRQMPYPVYNQVVQTLWELCYQSSAYIGPYAGLPEDPEGTEPGTSLVKVLQSEVRIARATLNQLRRYFVLCTWGERFCDGYIAGEFTNRGMLAVLRRLRTLRQAMPSEEGA